MDASGRFAVLDLVGEGGFARVYRGIDQLTDQVVAIKLAFGQDTSGDRLLAEGALLQTVSHPGIVRYIEHGRDPAGAAYLVLEWLDGSDLDQRLRKERLGVQEAIFLAEALARALEHIHAHGIVHLDLKPANIFLVGGSACNVRIVDFGIARRFGARNAGDRASISGSGTAPAGVRIGTPSYMSPEQARGESHIGPSSDIFSLGSVLFQCLTGERAFRGENDVATFMKVVLEEPRSIRELVPHVPKPISRLVARMQDKNTDSRLPDGAALVLELEHLFEHAQEPDLGGLTSVEQRVLSVIVAGQALAAREEAATLVVEESPDGALTLSETVRRFGGRIDPLAEGSLVVTLSGTAAGADQAQQAARCALALRKALPKAPIAVATAQGVVSAGRLAGRVIDRAVELLGVQDGRATTILLDEATASLVGNRFELRRDEDRCHLVREREYMASRMLLASDRVCVGRKKELGVLATRWAQCLAANCSHAILITGTAGLGKSHLCREFLRGVSAEGRGVEIWLGSGEMVRSGTAYGVVGAMVRDAAGIQVGDVLPERRRKIEQRVARCIHESERARRIAEFLGELADAPFDEADSIELAAARRDAAVMRDQIRRSWEDWIEAEAKTTPLLVIVDDLHWADLPSVKLIEEMIDPSQERPLLVIALARPEIRETFPDCLIGDRVSELILEGLSEAASEELIREVLPSASSEEIRRIAEAAAGHPFYLAEIAHTAHHDDIRELPPTVLAMVQARFAAISANARQVLRAASVFGEVFWRSGVDELLGSRRQLIGTDEELGILAEEQIIVENRRSRFFGECEYFFRHALFSEGAYSTLTDEDRRLGHRLAGQWLERAGETDAATLANHFERGEIHQRAVELFERAAMQALDASDFGSVLDRTSRALACGATGPAAGRMAMMQAEAHQWRGELEEAEQSATDALRLLPERSEAWYHAARDLAVASGCLGHSDTLAWLGGQVLASAADTTSEAARLVAVARTAIYLLDTGDYALAEPLLVELDKREGELEQFGPAVAGRVLHARAIQANYGGDSSRFLVLSERAAGFFHAIGDRRNECVQKVNAGFAYVQLGGYLQAKRVLEQAVQVAERLKLEFAASVARSNLGHALGRSGFPEGIDLVEQSAEELKAQGNLRGEGESRTYLAILAQRAGELERAHREACRAIECLEGAPPYRAYALGVRSRVHLARGDLDLALQDAEEAMKLLVSLERIEDGESLIRLAYAECLEAAGRMDEAERSILEADERLRTRAGCIADPIWKESFLTRVEENARTRQLAERVPG